MSLARAVLSSSNGATEANASRSTLLQPTFRLKIVLAMAIKTGNFLIFGFLHKYNNKHKSSRQGAFVNPPDGGVRLVASAVASTTSVPSASTAIVVARLHRTSFVDHQVATTHILAVHIGNGLVGLRVVLHLHEAEAFGATRVAVGDHFGREYSSQGCELILKIIVRSRVGKVTHV